MYAIEVRFIDEASNIRVGELINVNRVANDGHVDIEYVGDNEVDIMSVRSNGDDHIFRTHISQVASMRAVAEGLPLMPIVRLFDQDAEA